MWDSRPGFLPVAKGARKPAGSKTFFYHGCADGAVQAATVPAMLTKPAATDAALAAYDYPPIDDGTLTTLARR